MQSASNNVLTFQILLILNNAALFCQHEAAFFQFVATAYAKKEKASLPHHGNPAISQNQRSEIFRPHLTTGLAFPHGNS